MSATDSKPKGPHREARANWRLVVRGLEVRLRFLIALLLLAALMAGWPWLRRGYEQISSVWHPQGRHDAVAGDTEYFCPMDPGVVSAWPAICPACNMDLIPRKKTDAVILPEGVVARMQLSPYRVQLAGIRTTLVEPRAAAGQGEMSDELVVPVTAVIHQGGDHLVYVETMPGMFDGVRVQLGPRDGDIYPVIAGLKSGQRVASAGAFLIDAESRLHSGVATQYFGANASSRTPPLPKRRVESKSKSEPLSDADLALVKQQKVCPVTNAPLGSMGTPVFTLVQGRKVFLCCKGCESGLLANPEKYLAKLNDVAEAAEGEGLRAKREKE